MWALASSTTHLDICLRIAEEGRSRKLPYSFGIVYDELCRQQWAESARAGVVGFSADSVCLGIDRDIVSKVEAVMTQRKAVTQQSSKGQVCVVHLGL